tara:strand:+ start:4392 stop:6383 length:1992 start_codon:yes stop_codon:yes gene_type:complete
VITLALDFETFSRVDLKKVGTDNYASDLSTDVLCCSFIQLTDGAKTGQWLWFATEGGQLPEEISQALLGADEVQAQNARFDQLIYECIGVAEYGFPVLPLNGWVCSSAQARVNALPADLDGMSRATNAKYKKDAAGKALIRQLSTPDKKTGEFNKDPTLLGAMGRYCMNDTLTLIAAVAVMRPMTDTEKHDWLINERINDRGMRVDIELATLAATYAAKEKTALGERLSVLTNGVITKVSQSARLSKLLQEEFSAEPEFLDCITRPKGKFSADKEARAALLAKPELDDWTRKVVDLFDQGSNASVAKFTAMLDRADPDTDRVHGAFIFAGAGQTGRYSSKGLQLHNLRRDCWSAEDCETLKHQMREGRDITAFSGMSVMDTLAKLLRPTILPKTGSTFVVGDWSAIEARVLPWLSDSEGGEAVLDIFREGRDIYVETATGMGMTDRQLGKVATLSLGFGGAVGALQNMCSAYGIVITDKFAQTVVDKWRESNLWARQFWSDLENAALRAIRKPNEVFMAGRIRYTFFDKLMGGTLMCILPDESTISYPHARTENGEVTCMKASIPPAAASEAEWTRMRLWGGFLAENVTQATAAALLKNALYACEINDVNAVGHVHDEIILEVLDSIAETEAGRLQKLMEACPQWAEGLPLSADPAIMPRYGK